MNYQQAVDYIHSIGIFGSKPGLFRITELLECLGNPEKGLKVIHIAGTNGKGSTSAFIASMLQAAGFKVGLFTSPYIESFNERIQINRQPMPEEKLADLVSEIKPYCEEIAAGVHGHPTQFEINTAMAFHYFANEKVDFVVLEVGLGGRYDATNVIWNPLIGVITTIGLDHQAILGNTLEQIAFEKAGIIKPGMTVITGVQEGLPLNVIKEQAEKHNCQLLALSKDFYTKNRQLDSFKQSFQYVGVTGQSIEVKIDLLGIHQVNNAAVALTVIEHLKQKGFNISWQDALTGISKVHWPGRLEVMGKEPLIVLDGAHNSHATATLKKSIIELVDDKKIIAVIGILKDKDYADMIKDIAVLAHSIIITAPDYYRAINTDILVEESLKYCDNVSEVKPVAKAVEKAIQLASVDDMVLITGSLYTIGEARSYLRTK